MSHPEQWPLRHLCLRSLRLELRPDDDEGLRELVEEVYRGVHPPEVMPFLVPWTDADPAHLGRRVLQYYWSQRAEFAAERWTIHFLVRHEGRVIGVQSLGGVDFGIVRQVHTGSWVGLRHQRRGFGTEMRAAVLAFAFDHLGAVAARSAAFVDNPASQRVSARLGYRPDGTATFARRGQAADEVRLLVTAEQFVRSDWTLSAEGVDACRPLLGAAAP